MPPSTAVRRALVLRCESVISRTIAVRGTGASGIHSPHRGTTPTASTSSLLRRFSLSSSPPQATGSPATKEVSRPKRPSPYRLLQPHAFLAAFASLHLAGWRLDVLRPGPASSQPPSDSSASDQLRKLPESLRDLQGRRLVTVFELPSGKHGWSTAQQLLHAIGESATKTNHHPSISLCPISDYLPPFPLFPALDAATGYVLEIATHTHTPMPAPGSTGEPGSPLRPGVTGKDLQLASEIEKVYGDLVGTQS